MTNRARKGRRPLTIVLLAVLVFLLLTIVMEAMSMNTTAWWIVAVIAFVVTIGALAWYFVSDRRA